MQLLIAKNVRKHCSKKASNLENNQSLKIVQSAKIKLNITTVSVAFLTTKTNAKVVVQRHRLQQIIRSCRNKNKKRKRWKTGSLCQQRRKRFANYALTEKEK